MQKKDRYEDVFLTYVYPKQYENKPDILQCIIYSKNGFVKIGLDVWRELNIVDYPSHPVITFKNLEEMEKEYTPQYSLKFESCKKQKRLLGVKTKERRTYGLPRKKYQRVYIG